MISAILRADATVAIGNGHLLRSLALAEAIQACGGRSVILTQCDTEAIAERARRANVRFVAMDHSHPHPADITETLRAADAARHQSVGADLWVSADGYHFDERYHHEIRRSGARLLVIDDYAHLTSYNVDVLLNQNIGSDTLDYRGELGVRLLGPAYALLRPEFTASPRAVRSEPPVARRVLVSLGGADPRNATATVVRALTQITEPLECTVVVGYSNPHRPMLEELARCSNHVRLLCGVDDMRELMVTTDLAIAGAGTTCWELAYLGVPAMTIVLAENQRRIAEGLARAGMTINLGWHHALDTDHIRRQVGDLIVDRNRRCAMSAAGRQLVDGHGSGRVARRLAGVCSEIN